MQIFVSSPDPVACARALDDRRVIKMAVEAAQILCTASTAGPYKPTHVNHPCVRWAAADRCNLFWLRRHLQALTDEYTYRFGRTHLTATRMSNFVVHPGGPPRSFCNCTNLTGDSVFELYRQLLNTKWSTGTQRWTRRQPPEWRA